MRINSRTDKDPNLHHIIGPEETLKDLPYVAGPAAEGGESLHGNF